MTLSLRRANGKPRALARKPLDIQTRHRDLSCVRDGSRLKGLPPQERPAWQAFWAEIDALRKGAQGDRP
jgi:hypothetical protein